jgi:hypothetical protein
VKEDETSGAEPESVLPNNYCAAALRMHIATVSASITAGRRMCRKNGQSSSLNFFIRL